MDILTLRTILTVSDDPLMSGLSAADKKIDDFIKKPRGAVQIGVAMGTGGSGTGGSGSYGGDPQKIAAAMIAKLEHDLQLSQQRQSNIAAEGTAKRAAIASQGAQQVINAQLRSQQQLEAAEARHQQKMAQQAEEFARRQAQLANRRGTFADRMQGLQRSGYYNVAAGASLTATVTAPVLGAGVGALKFSGDFQEAMQKVITLTDVSRGELEGLKKDVLALSTDTRIRQGPTELAEALYFVTSTGLKGADGMKVLRAAALGASAGLGETKVVANTLTTVLDAYGLSADKAVRVTDTLTQAVKFGKGEADAYAAAFPKVIAIAAQAGVTFEEVAAQMASATRVGLTPSETATALRQIFNNLIDPSEKAKKAMKEMGTSVQELRIMLRGEGLFNTLKFLTERTGGRIGPITELFGSIRALTGFLSTTGEHTLQEYKHTLEEIQNASGATFEAAGTASETFRFKLDKFLSTVERVGIEMGNKFLPPATQMVDMIGQKLPTAIDVAVRSWEALPAPVRKVLLDITALVLLAGPIKLITGNLQILASVLLGLGSASGLTSLVGSLKAMAALGPIRSLSDLSTAASLSGLGAGLGSMAVALPVIVALLGAAAIAWQVYRTRIDEADIAQHNLQMGTEQLGRTLGRAMTIAAGNNRAVEAVRSLQAAVNDAGNDIPKLQSALKRVNDAKLEIKSLGLAPAAEQALLAQYDRLKRQIESQKIQVEFEAEPGESLRQIIERSLLGHDAQGPVDSARLALSPILFPLEKVAGAAKSVWDWGTTAQGQPQPAQAAPAPKVFTTPGVAADQQNAQKLVDISKATYKQLQDELDGYNKKAAAGQQLSNNELMRFTQVKARRDQLIADAKKAGQDADRIARERAADEAERQRRIAEETAERLRRIEAQSLQERLRLWQTYGNAVESILGRIQEFGGEDSKSQKAAMQAQMMKREFADIPPHLKAVVVGLGAIYDKMNALTQVRDKLRGLFQDMWKNALVSGSDTGVLQQSAAFMAKRLNYEERMQALHGAAGRGATTVLNFAEAQRAAASSRIEVLQEAGRTRGEVYDGSTGGSGATAATSSTGMRIAEHAISLQSRGIAQKFVHMCDRLADTTVRDVTNAYSSIMGPRSHDTAARTMRRFQRAGIGQPYQPGMAVAPGGLLYAGHGGDGAGHVATIGPHGERLDQYGSNKFRASYFDWYVPPPGAASIVPPGSPAGRRVAATPALLPAKAARPFTAPPPQDFDGSLLGLLLPKGWGPTVTNNKLAPGETREWRLRVQEMLTDEKEVKKAAKAVGMSVDEYAAAWRRIAERQDAAAAAAAASDKARTALRDMYQKIRLAGKENNPYLALMDAMERGDYNRNTPGERKNLLEATLGGMVADATAQTKEFLRGEADKQKVLAAGAPYLQGATADLYAYERATALTQKRVELWNKYQPLRDVADKMEARGDTAGARSKRRFANQQFRAEYAAFETGFNAEEQGRNLREGAEAATEFARASSLLVAQRRLLNDIAGAPEAQITEALQQLTDAETKYAELRKNHSEADARRMANDYAFREGVLRQMRRQIETQREYDKAIRESEESVALQGAVQNIMRSTPAYSPERARQIAEETERRRLLAAAAGDMGKQGNVPGQLSAFMNDYDARAATQAVDAYTQRLGDLDRELFSLGDTTGLAGVQFDVLHGQFSQLENSGELLINTLRNLKAQMGFDTSKEILSGQQQFEEGFLGGARARLEAQIRYRDMIEQARVAAGGAPLPAEYSGAQAGADSQRLNAADRSDLQQRIIRQLEAVKNLEMAAAQTATQRVEIEQRYQDLIRQRLEITLSAEAAEAEAAQRADDRVAAQMEDAVARTQRGAAMMRDAIRNGLEDGVTSGLKTLAERIKGQLLDNLATYLTNRLSRGFLDTVAGREGQLDARIPGYGLPTTGGFAGPIGVAAGIAQQFVPTPEQYPTAGSPAYIAAQAAGIFSGGGAQSVGEVTLNAQIVNVNGGVAGGLSGGGNGKPTDTQIAGTFLRGIAGMRRR